jgi:hypothetical protein
MKKSVLKRQGPCPGTSAKVRNIIFDVNVIHRNINAGETARFRRRNKRARKLRSKRSKRSKGARPAAKAVKPDQRLRQQLRRRAPRRAPPIVHAAR